MLRLMLAAIVMIAAAGSPQALVAQHGGTLPNETAVSPADVPPPEVDEPDATEAASLTGQALAVYRSWPGARQTTYNGWPGEYRAYFWKLNPTQQRIWWSLTDAQKATVFGLTPGQRLAAWQVIEARLGAQAPAP